MRGGPIGRRYARALLDLAEERGEVEKIGKDLNDLVAMWNESRELRDVFLSPTLTAEERRKVAENLAERAGLSPMVNNVLLMLSDRRRMRSLADIADAYGLQAEERAGRVRAEVITATPMAATYYVQLQKVLEQTTGKKVVLVKKQDPSLIAGVVTRVGDQVFDGSIKNRLDELKDELLSR